MTYGLCWEFLYCVSFLTNVVFPAPAIPKTIRQIGVSQKSRLCTLSLDAAVADGAGSLSAASAAFDVDG